MHLVHGAMPAASMQPCPTPLAKGRAMHIRCSTIAQRPTLRSSEPFLCRFLANCAFQDAASLFSEYLSVWVSRHSAPMLCTGAIWLISCN